MKSLLLILALTVIAARAAETNINAAPIYLPVFSNIAAWAAANPGFAQSPYTNTTGPQADAAFKELQPQLAALDAAESATYCDWGTRYEDGAAAVLPFVSPARKATMAALWAASYSLSNNLPGFADYAMKAMQISRNLGEDRLLIDLLVQIAGEKAAAEMLAGNIDKLDAGQLETLDQKLQSLPPGASMVEAMQMEKAMFIDNLIKQVLKAMREADTNIFEQIEDDASSTNSAACRTNLSATAAGAATAGKTSWLAENLRLSSIVDSGGSYKIGFETRDGDSFVISLGRPKRGIELISADYAREEAIIARSNETAIVKLKSRKIAPVRLRLRMPSPAEAQKLLDSGVASATNAAQKAMLNLAAIGSDTGDKVHGLIAATGGTADGLMNLLNKTSAEYGEWIDAFQRLPLDKFREWQKKFLENATLLTQLLLPAVDKAAEREKQLLASRARLAAAIAARRAALAR